MKSAVELARESQKSSDRRRGATKIVVIIVAVLVVVPATLLASSSGWDRFWKAKPTVYPTSAVDRGNVYLYVSELGSLDSANNTKILCKVEALTGVVGGTQNAQGKAAGATGGTAATASTAAGGAASTTANGQAATQTTATADAAATASKSSAKSKTTSSRKSSIRKVGSVKSNPSTLPATGTASTSGGSSSSTQSNTGSTSMSSNSMSGATSTGSSTGGTSSSTSSATGTGAATNNPKPAIKSFTYQVAAYTPLKPAAKAAATTTTPKAQTGGQGGGGGGSRGGGGPQNQQEKPGATRIVTLLEEGTPVKAGDVVCTLDASTFDDELRSQRIRFIQAQATVSQATSMLEVNKIAYNEYKNGTYPLDVEVLKSYRKMCAVATDQAKRNLEWSLALADKKLRTKAQLSADRDQYRQALLLEAEAELMENRLIKYTGPKILTSLEAKIEANKADLFAQQASFEIESDRLRRLEDNVKNCTIRAPEDGIVVYANTANGWGRVETQIQEGATVRQGQAILNLPDPKHMRVRTRINESSIAFIHAGQKARIIVEAFPDDVLMGTVTEVTAIPAPANGPISDVKVYYAMVNIDSTTSANLRPGLSAEVQFACDMRSDVVRLPFNSLRWVDQHAYAAVPSSTKEGFEWKSVEVGLIGLAYVEVLSGVEPGEQVISNVQNFPRPDPSKVKPGPSRG